MFGLPRFVFHVVAVALVAGFSLSSFGLDTTGSTETTLQQSALTNQESRWTIEANVQAHSVAASGSPWVGIGASYRLFTGVDWGLRGFVPLSRTVDFATYSIQTYVRLRLIHGTYTDFIFEGDYAENFYEFQPFNSYGLAIGAVNRVSPGLSIGVIGGLEAANVVVDSIGLEQENSIVVYPKIAFIADFAL